jgi:hypothetical protein
VTQREMRMPRAASLLPSTQTPTFGLDVVVARRGQTILGGGSDQDLLQITDVASDVAAIGERA